jgi:hypothetical protein
MWALVQVVALACQGAREFPELRGLRGAGIDDDIVVRKEKPESL